MDTDNGSNQGVPVSANMVREGLKLQELFEKPEGAILVKAMETLYADTLAAMLDPEASEKQMSECRTRCHVILDFAEQIGMRVSGAAMAIQQTMAKRNIRTELGVNAMNQGDAISPRGGVY